MSDENFRLVIQLLTALGVFLGPIILALLNKSQAREVVRQANIVRDVLAKTTVTTNRKLEGLEQTANSTNAAAKATHILVNSNMGTQLKLNAVISKRLADITNDLNDRRVADEAERLLQDHISKQMVVDAEEEGGGEKTGGA